MQYFFRHTFAWHIDEGLEPTQISSLSSFPMIKLLQCLEAVCLIFSVSEIKFLLSSRFVIFSPAFSTPCLFIEGTGQSWLTRDIILSHYLRRLAARKQFARTSLIRQNGRFKECFWKHQDHCKCSSRPSVAFLNSKTILDLCCTKSSVKKKKSNIRLLICIIKFSTSDNAFRVHGLVRSILVISSYTFVWPYMVNDFAKLIMFSPESEIFVWIKPKKKRKTF